MKEIIEDETYDLLDCVAMNSWTPVMFACRYGYLDIVRFFHSKGASFERDKGYCAIHAACYGGDKDVLVYLLEEVKVNVNPES